MPATPVIGAQLGESPSLRERKKLATRLGIRRAALDLIAERGFSHVTVEDIAAAAGVSPRTFFNYFPSKEAVLFGGGPVRAEELRARLAAELPGATALDALRAVLTDYARNVVAQLVALGGDPARWVRQMKAAQADSQLRAAQAAHMAQVEAGIAAGLAERLRADPSHDAYPPVLASAAVGLLRATLAFWAASGGTISLEHLIDAAFQALADGFPEASALRDVSLAVPTSSPDRKDSST